MCVQSTELEEYIWNLSDDPGHQFTEAVNVLIRHLTTVHFPETYGETVHITFPIIWFSIQDLSAKFYKRVRKKDTSLSYCLIS